MADMEIEIYEAEHQPLWLLDLEDMTESEDKRNEKYKEVSIP